VLRVGDRVLFEEVECTVVGLTGMSVRLHSAGRVDAVVLLPHLLLSKGFALLDARRRADQPPAGQHRSAGRTDLGCVADMRQGYEPR
jgi:hypothetical protein